MLNANVSALRNMVAAERAGIMKNAQESLKDGGDAKVLKDRMGALEKHLAALNDNMTVGQALDELASVHPFPKFDAAAETRAWNARGKWGMVIAGAGSFLHFPTALVLMVASFGLKEVTQARLHGLEKQFLTNQGAQSALVGAMRGRVAGQGAPLA